MAGITKNSVYTTRDGMNHKTLASAKAWQARLNLVETFCSEEWEDTLGTADPNLLLRFIEQNKDTIREFLNPQSMGVKL